MIIKRDIAQHSVPVGVISRLEFANKGFIPRKPLLERGEILM